MRKNFGAKPWTYPQPVFILATYNEDGPPRRHERGLGRHQRGQGAEYLHQR